MNITSEYVQLSVADGTSMHAYSALPSKPGVYPGLIIFQEAFGVNHHIRDVAERFAREGYIAIAPELYHRSTEKGFEANYNDFAAVQSHLHQTSNETFELDSRAVWNWLISHPQIQEGSIASIGYCMGGRASFVANTILPLKAAISYYGGRIAPDLMKSAPSLHAPMLFFWGGLDKHIPPEQIQSVMKELRNAGKQFINVEFSNADHAFFCDERPSYNEQAAKESWVMTLEFLKNKLAP